MGNLTKKEYLLYSLGRELMSKNLSSYIVVVEDSTKADEIADRFSREGSVVRQVLFSLGIIYLHSSLELADIRKMSGIRCASMNCKWCMND